MKFLSIVYCSSFFRLWNFGSIFALEIHKSSAIKIENPNSKIHKRKWEEIDVEGFGYPKAILNGRRTDVLKPLNSSVL